MTPTTTTPTCSGQDDTWLRGRVPCRRAAAVRARVVHGLEPLLLDDVDHPVCARHAAYWASFLPSAPDAAGVLIVGL